MPSKKKKKPAANPARGFATTSVASKPKAEDVTDSADASDAGSAVTVPTSVASEDVKLAHDATQGGTKTAVAKQVTAEELEEQLERDDLQLLMEKVSRKVQRDASRQVVKVETDRRVLRTQAQPLYTRDCLPDELMLEVIELVKGDLFSESLAVPNPKPLSSSGFEDDAVTKLWTLRQALAELYISDIRIDATLRWICDQSIQDEPMSIWGFEESLDYLAITDDGKDLPVYDQPYRKPASLLDEDISDVDAKSSIPKWKIDREKEQRQGGSSVADASVETEADDDFDVSDMASDVEPDELLTAYIEAKTRLYKIDGRLVQEASAKSTKTRGRQSGDSKGTLPLTAGVRKLKDRLNRIESDILFDSREADVAWVEREIELRKEQADLQRYGISSTMETPTKPTGGVEYSDKGKSRPSAADDIMMQAGDMGDMFLDEDLDGEGGLMSGMFTAPDAEEPKLGTTGARSTDSTIVKIRDFGKQVGLRPRRVLEEACRARDSGSTCSFKVISPSTYTCRSSVTVKWSKEQDTIPDVELPGIHGSFRKRSSTFNMTEVATPGSEQSESFISTAALFLITTSTARDDKAYLRLPANWRNLWSEFADVRKEKVEATDRETLKGIRGLLRESQQQEHDDEIVLSDAIRKRNAGSKRTDTDNGAATVHQHTQIGTSSSDELVELWRVKSANASYQQMLQSRKDLPMYRFKETALETIDRHQVTILCGDTGCGKSTQLPSFILEHQLSQGKPCRIYCTEPRRISAISLAQRVSEELGERKGEVGTARSLIGYAIRLESHVNSNTRLVFATVGIVLRMLESLDGLKEVTHLIIDEVHERSIDTDFLLVVLRTLMVRRPELKVILMSATVDTSRFSKYLDNAPVVNVPGRTFAVETKFLEDAIELTNTASDSGAATEEADSDVELDEDERGSGLKTLPEGYSSATRQKLSKYDEYRMDYSLMVRLIKKVAFDASHRDYSKAILVFLPGIAEIRQLNNMLSDALGRDWLIHPLHSTIASEDQQAAFQMPPAGMRKVVLATNIAETGITIPDITCVIDTAKHKEMRFDERRQVSRLVQSFISRANAKQRRGRAGRVQEGLCFHLVTKYRHDNLMHEQQTPEMLRLSLQELVMRVKVCKLGGIEETLSGALDPPSAKNIRRAIDALVEVGALTPGEELTPLGRQLAKLPLDANLGKLALLGSVFSTVDVAVTIGAVLSSKDPFTSPMGSKQLADQARLAFKRSDSDLLTVYNAYCAWRRVCTNKTESEWAFTKKNYLSAQTLSNIEDLKSQLLSALVDAGFIPLSPSERQALSRYRPSSRSRQFVAIPAAANINADNDALANASFAWSFYPKILTRDGKGWRNIANNQTVSLHPTSVNKYSQPLHMNFLSYHSIMQSSAAASKFYNAHSTSYAHPLLLILGAGDVDVRVHCGVIVVDGNRLRVKVDDWPTAVAIKYLRSRTREIVNASFKSPAKALTPKLQRWLDVLRKVFERADRRNKI